MIKSILIAGAGGFVGTALRYVIGVVTKQMFHGDFPVGTFIVNIVGCLIIGIVFGLAEKSEVLTSNQVLLLATGFCGGFTTFSAFANEAFTLGSKGDFMLGFMYVVGSILLGVVSVWIGRIIVSQ